MMLLACRSTLRAYAVRAEVARRDGTWWSRGASRRGASTPGSARRADDEAVHRLQPLHGILQRARSRDHAGAEVVPAVVGGVGGDVDRKGDGQVADRDTHALLVGAQPTEQTRHEDVVHRGRVGFAHLTHLRKGKLEDGEPPGRGCATAGAETGQLLDRAYVRRTERAYRPAPEIRLARAQRAFEHETSQRIGSLPTSHHHLRRRAHPAFPDSPDPGPSLLQGRELVPRGVGLEVEQVGHHVQGSDAIGDGMVHTHQENRSSSFHARDEGGIPQGLGGIERSRREAGGHRQHRRDRAVARCAHVADVAHHVERIVGNPGRTSPVPAVVNYSLPHARHCSRGALEGLTQDVVVRFAAQDQGRIHDRSSRRIGVTLEQQSVERCHQIRQVVRHCFPFRSATGQRRDRGEVLGPCPSRRTVAGGGVSSKDLVTEDELLDLAAGGPGQVGAWADGLREELLGDAALTQERPKLGDRRGRVAPRLGTTHAHAVSPRRSCGSGTSATSLMAGWVRRMFSISTTGMFSPPRMMMSFVRPLILR